MSVTIGQIIVYSWAAGSVAFALAVLVIGPLYVWNLVLEIRLRRRALKEVR